MKEIIGLHSKTKIVKNKVAAPFKIAEFDIMYNEGISKQGELLALGEKFKLVTKSGTSYVYGEEKLGRGYDAARTYLRDTKKVSDKLEKAIRKELEAGALSYAGSVDPEENERPE